MPDPSSRCTNVGGVLESQPGLPGLAPNSSVGNARRYMRSDIAAQGCPGLRLCRCANLSHGLDGFIGEVVPIPETAIEQARQFGGAGTEDWPAAFQEEDGDEAALWRIREEANQPKRVPSLEQVPVFPKTGSS